MDLFSAALGLALAIQPPPPADNEIRPQPRPAPGPGARPPQTRYRDAEGRRWTIDGRTAGIVLTADGVRLQINSDCTAHSSEHGDGRWEWANGGFLAIFGEVRIGFPSQEIDAGQGENCRA